MSIQSTIAAGLNVIETSANVVSTSLAAADTAASRLRMWCQAGLQEASAKQAVRAIEFNQSIELESVENLTKRMEKFVAFSSVSPERSALCLHYSDLVKAALTPKQS